MAIDLKEMFKGVLDDDAISKIESNSNLKTRLMRGGEFVDLLDEGKVPPELINAPGAPSLEQLTATLNSSLTAFETRFTPKIAEVAKTEAQALINPLVEKFTSELANASSRAAWIADTMGQIRAEHKETFGEKFDEAALNTWVKEQQTTGRSFGNVREAYDAWMGPKRIEKQLAEAREEGKRDALSAQKVPGVSPAPATGVVAKLRAFKSGTNSGLTSTEKLDQKLAEMDRKTAAA